MAKTSQIDYTIIIAAIIVVGGLLLGAAYLFPKQGNERTISVTGTAQTSVLPDRAIVYVQVVTRSNTSATEAKDMNANISNAVMAALLKTGVNSSDIETQGFTVGEEYNYPPVDVTIPYPIKSNETTTYVATNSMMVTISNFDNVGKIVDAAVNSGALISYINYDLSLSKQNEYKAAVLANASQDAKANAQAIVAGLGKSLGDLVSVSTSGYNYAPYPIYSAASAPGVDVKQIATNLPPSKIDITASVDVTYNVV
jgi:uncharacterized protein YggE